MKNIKNIIATIVLLTTAVTVWAQPTTLCNDRVVIDIPFKPVGVTPTVQTTDNPTSVGIESDHERVIFWAHGLGSNSGGWQRAGAATQDPVAVAEGYPAREVISNYLDLTQNNAAISTSASVMKSQILQITDGLDQTEEEYLQNILIGHSQGGIVGRYLDQLYEDPVNAGERRFGGIVTFGSAHQGARILNSAIPDPVTDRSLIQDFGETACDALGDGPIVEGIETNFFLDLITDGELIELISDAICGIIADVAPIFLSDFNANIAMDYIVGGPVINEMNQGTSNIPRVAFYGQEDDPVFWRVVHYMQNDPNDDGYFGAMNDDETVATINSNTMSYRARSESWGNLAFLLGFIEIPENDQERADLCESVDLEPDCFDGINDVTEILDIVLAWARGYEWWINSDDYWRVLTGANQNVPYSNFDYCRCATRLENGQWSDFEPNSLSFSECVSDYANGLWCQVVWAGDLDIERLPSDGVVLANSAGGWPDTNSFPLEGSSHPQMRNDVNTKIRLLELWDGMVHDPFFNTDPE